MIFGSVCSGIEAASLAWGPLGMKAAWFFENDAFPSAVLAHRFPNVPNLGDLLQFRRRAQIITKDVDILVGGTPCQSFSVAGNRGGIADQRGALALAMVELARITSPKWIVWENVPGVLSSRGGWDFACFIRALVDIGYGCAWRVLDAQGFGVPQRRRRVFVVGCLGDAARAREVLSLGEGGPRDIEAVQEAPAGDAAPVNAGPRRGRVVVGVRGHIAHALMGEGHDASEDGTGRGTPVVASYFGGGRASQLSIATTLNSKQRYDYESETFVVDAKDTGHAFCFAENSRAEIRLEGGDGQRTGCVSGRGGKVGQSTPAIVHAGRIRRLTPRECERLQGMPDDWTKIPWRNQPADECPDGHRYKAIGNSMAVPVMRWIGIGIKAQEDDK